MLVIEVGVKFRTVSVKCANIFDQDCRLLRPFNIDIAHKPTCKLRSKFTNHKDKTNITPFTCLLAKTAPTSTLDKRLRKFRPD
jgi:hypothetical protein